MSGVLVNLLFLFKVHLKAVPQLQDRLVRLANAAHYLSWMDLAGNEHLQSVEYTNRCVYMLARVHKACLASTVYMCEAKACMHSMQCTINR
jgi:GTP cyclohydrolase II